MMLYRYLRPLPPVLPNPLQAEVVDTPYTNLADINGDYLAVGSYSTSYYQPSYNQMYQIANTGAITWINTAYYINNSFTYNANQYVGNVNDSVAAASNGYSAVTWRVGGTGTPYGGTNYTDYLRLFDTPGVGSGMNVLTINDGAKGQNLVSLVRWAPATGANALANIIATNGQSPTALNLFYGGLVSPLLYNGALFNTQKTFSYANRKLFDTVWISSTQLLVGFYATSATTTAVSYDIYDITTGALAYGSVSGIPTAPPIGTPLTTVGASRMIQLDSTRLIHCVISTNPAWTGGTVVPEFFLTSTLLQYNGAGGYTTLDTLESSANSSSRVFPCYLGNNRIMIMMLNNTPGQPVLFDISGNTFDAKEVSGVPSQVYWAGGHLGSGNLITVEYGSTIAGPPQSVGRVNSYAIPATP